jgi:hypothetical protein
MTSFCVDINGRGLDLGGARTVPHNFFVLMGIRCAIIDCCLVYEKVLVNTYVISIDREPFWPISILENL